MLAYRASAALDRYFLEKERGKQPRRPQLRMSRWWSNILDAIDQRLPKMWSILGTDLLSVPIANQERFAELMRGIKANVLSGHAERGDRVLMIARPKQRSIAIAGVSYIDRTRVERDARLIEAARQVVGPDGSEPSRVIVLGCDPRIVRLPYSVIVLAEFGDEGVVLYE
jgi:hypothetical protein